MTWLRLCIYQCDEWPFVHKPKGGPGWRQWICSAQSTGWQETKPLLLNYHKCFATCVLCLKGCTKASKFIISTAQPIGFGLNHAKSMAICPSGPAPRGNASVKTEPWISLCYDLRLESIAQDSQDEPIKWMASCSLLQRSSAVCVMNMIYWILHKHWSSASASVSMPQILLKFFQKSNLIISQGRLDTQSTITSRILHLELCAPVANHGILSQIYWINKGLITVKTAWNRSERWPPSRLDATLSIKTSQWHSATLSNDLSGV